MNLEPFKIDYNEGIQIQTFNLNDFFKDSDLPLKFLFKKQVNDRLVWEVDLNNNSWAMYPTKEMIDVEVKTKYERIVYKKEWDVINDGSFIYKKLWLYCVTNENNKGLIVGTHNGEFGEWVPIILNELSQATLIEASQKQFQSLIENFQQKKNVEFLNELITPNGDNILFYEGGEGYTNTVLKRVIDYWEKEPITQTLRSSIKFSDLITPDITWIHTDVEGIDYQLIMSLSDQQLSQLDVIIYEYNNSSPEEREIINNFLIDRGFKTYRENGVSIAWK